MWLSGDSSSRQVTGPRFPVAPEVARSRSLPTTPIVCRKMFDEIPVDTLSVGRYTFRATLARADSTLVEDGQAPIALVDDGESP